MDKGAGPLPPAGAPGQPSGGSDDGQGSGKPPPIPPAPDGPGRSYGVPTAAGYPPQGVPAAPGPHGYGGGPPGYGSAGGYPGHGARPGAGGGYGAGAYAPYGWYGPPPPVGKSVAAMVVGIGSVVLVLTCWGSFLAVLSSPVALVLGVSARRAVARGAAGRQRAGDGGVRPRHRRTGAGGARQHAPDPRPDGLVGRFRRRAGGWRRRLLRRPGHPCAGRGGALSGLPEQHGEGRPSTECGGPPLAVPCPFPRSGRRRRRGSGSRCGYRFRGVIKR